MKYLSIVFIALTFFSCKLGDDSDSNFDLVFERNNTTGLSYARAGGNVDPVFNQLTNNITANGISIVAEINHKANAATIGEDLNNARLVLFGNPNLGTPLMQKNQLAGLDLPQKMLVYQDDNSNVLVAFNNITYLAARHDVGSVSTIADIDQALSNLLFSVTGPPAFENVAETPTIGQGIVTVVSNNDFDTTYSNLQNALNSNDNITIMAELDHQNNAAQINMELRPTSLIVFGNPVLGTPLMQNQITTAIDLPQKFLVWEDENGQVNISFNDPQFLKERHKITGNEETLSTIANALSTIANEAAE